MGAEYEDDDDYSRHNYDSAKPQEGSVGAVLGTDDANRLPIGLGYSTISNEE